MNLFLACLIALAILCGLKQFLPDSMDFPAPAGSWLSKAWYYVRLSLYVVYVLAVTALLIAVFGILASATLDGIFRPSPDEDEPVTYSRQQPFGD